MATLRQKKAIDKVVETRGISISQAMRDAGYDDTTAKNPKNLTESKAWKDLMAEYLPDDLLGQKHKELLNKLDDKGSIDVQAVKAGLDMAYKLKGSYAPEKSTNLNLNVDAQPSDVDLDELVKEVEEKLKEKKT